MAIALRVDGGGGYDYNFVVPPPDWLICNICHCPSKEPFLSGCCGNIFCESCLEGAKKATTTTDACPICRDEEFITFRHKQADRAVRALHLFCSNKEKGCEWQGELNNIINHLQNNDGCQFEEVTCTNDCGECIRRQYLTSHFEDECIRRKVDCQYCHIAGEFQVIEGEHKEACPKFPIPCPNKCEADYIPREDIDDHRMTCPLEEVICPNDCGMRLQRCHLATHGNKDCTRRNIVCPFCQVMGEYQFIEGEHKELCPKFPVPCPNKCQADALIREDIEKHKTMCPLEAVTCPIDCGVIMKRQSLTTHVKMECPHRKVTCQYCHTTEEHQFIEGEHKEQCCKFPLACPNKCEIGSVPRENVEEHMKVCPLELIQCEYHVVGCEERMVRKDQKKHNKEKLEEHLSFTAHQLSNTQRNIATGKVAAVNSKEKQLVKFPTTGGVLDDTEPLLTGAPLNIVQTTDKFLQINAPTEKFSNVAQEDQQTRQLQDNFQQLIATTDELSQKLANMEKTITVNAGNALAKLETKFQTKITEIETSAQKRIAELENKLDQKMQQIEILLKVTWNAQIISQAGKLSSGDQVAPVIVKMLEYTKNKAEKKTWYSDPFYTHHEGYQIQACIHPDGKAHTSSCLTVRLYLMKGPYDEQLKWPLKGHCEVKLLNQISDSEHHLSNGKYYNDAGHPRVVGERIRSDTAIWYSNVFILDKGLRENTAACQYLKDDCIFLQVKYKLD